MQINVIVVFRFFIGDIAGAFEFLNIFNDNVPTTQYIFIY